MTVASLKEYFRKQLKPLFPAEEIDHFFYSLSTHFLDLKRIDIALEPGFRLNTEALTRFKAALERLKKEEPIQYIIGETEFFNIRLKVGPEVLIPRPETEELVDLIIKDLSGTPSPSILDIGTGSGCIAIALAKNVSGSTVTALDISEKALELAGRNSKQNNTDVQFVKFDILNPAAFAGTFDVIVSNPPYVTESERSAMKKNVLDYEPHSALFVPDEDPLIFYKHIADFAIKHLKKGGRLYFEINQYLGEETSEVLSGRNFKDVSVIKDIFGNERIIRARM